MSANKFFNKDFSILVVYIVKKLIIVIFLSSFSETVLCTNSGSVKIDSILTHVNDYSVAVEKLRYDVPVEDLKQYEKSPVDELAKCKIYNALCWFYFSSDPPKAMDYAKLQSALALKLDNIDAKINSYDNMAYLHLGFGNYDNAISFMLKSLKAKEAINDTAGISVSLSGLGGIYQSLGNSKLALKYNLQVYEIEKNAGRKKRAAVLLNNVGLNYQNMGNIEKALETYFMSIELYNEAGIDSMAGNEYGNIGSIYLDLKEYDKSLIYLKKGSKRLEKKGNVSSLANINSDISQVYSAQNDFTNALIYGAKAVKYANLSEDKEVMMLSNSKLAQVFYKNKNYRFAYEHFRVAFKLKDSLYSENSSKQIAEMQTKYDSEKKEAENSLLLAKQEVDKVELDKKNSQQKMLGIGLGLALLVVIYVMYSLNQKKKTNKLLNVQNEIIEEKNKDITDSINYAQRIQNAILPEDGLLEKHFDSFVYYRPKDIVSGDFYWIKEVGDKIYFSVVDCTGHGVPGAFMSIIGHNSLNRIIDDFGIFKTGEILDKLNELVIDSVGAKNTEYMTIRDGMDLSICCIDKKNNTVEYSGAQNNLYLLRNNKELINGVESNINENDINLFEFKADKMAVGGAKNDKKYITHSISLEKKDTIYLFSDGYPDQFGGPKGRKFMYKQFKKMFLDVQNLPMDKQLSHIDNTMVDWMGNREQLDDICVMGVKI